MKKSLFGQMLTGLLTVAGLSAVHGQGILPPPPTPHNFVVVNVEKNNASATWTAQAGGLIFAIDNGPSVVVDGAMGFGELKIPINISVPHTFTLTATGWGGNSSPAIFNYVPAVPKTTLGLPYVLKNLVSATTVRADLFIDPDYSSKNRLHITETIGGSSETPGLGQPTAGNAYLVYAFGFVNGRNTQCGTGPLIVETPGALWPSGKVITVTYHLADNPGFFNCELALQ